MGKKCNRCDCKIDKDFKFCPWCGFDINQDREKNNFGMIGREDSINSKIEMPGGFGNVINSLMKQVSKNMSVLNGDKGGFKIQISSGGPVVRDNRISGEDKSVEKDETDIPVSDKERKRRNNLEYVSAESKVRRFSNAIVYEILAPGVKTKKDVVIGNLENGIEVRAYSSDKCYYKSIPLKVEVLSWYVKDEKVFVELKG